MRSRGSRRRPLMEMIGVVSGSDLNGLPNQHDWFFHLPVYPPLQLLFLPLIVVHLFFHLFFCHWSVFLHWSSKSQSWIRASNRSALGSSDRVSVVRRSTRLKSMVVYCTVLLPSCPPTCPLRPWGRSRLHGAPSRASGCAFGNRGMSCKLSLLFVSLAHIVLMTLSLLVCLVSDIHFWLLCMDLFPYLDKLTGGCPYLISLHCQHLFEGVISCRLVFVFIFVFCLFWCRISGIQWFFL